MLVFACNIVQKTLIRKLLLQNECLYFYFNYFLMHIFYLFGKASSLFGAKSSCTKGY